MFNLDLLYDDGYMWFRTTRWLRVLIPYKGCLCDEHSHLYPRNVYYIMSDYAFKDIFWYLITQGCYFLSSRLWRLVCCLVHIYIWLHPILILSAARWTPIKWKATFQSKLNRIKVTQLEIQLLCEMINITPPGRIAQKTLNLSQHKGKKPASSVRRKNVREGSRPSFIIFHIHLFVKFWIHLFVMSWFRLIYY